jgi:hypothetical protein
MHLNQAAPPTTVSNLNYPPYIYISPSFSLLFCLPTIIEDSPNLTSPPTKHRTNSTSRQRNSNLPTLPLTPTPSSATGYSPYNPEQAAAYQQYMQNHNPGPGGYRA